MKDSDSVQLAVVAFMLGVLATLLFALAVTTPNHIWRQEAIEHNAAEYVCDPATGETEFRWKESGHAR